MKMKKLNGGITILSLMLIQCCKSVNYVIESNRFYYQTSKNIKKWIMPTSLLQEEASGQEKEIFAKACRDEIMKLKDSHDGRTIQEAGVNLEEFAFKSCDCAIKKVEKKYENPSDADKDLDGMTKISEECGRDMMMELMKK